MTLIYFFYISPENLRNNRNQNSKILKYNIIKTKNC